MGKIAERFKLRDQTKNTEGRFFGSFVFGGELYTITHTLSRFEIQNLKNLLTQFGHEAKNSVVSQQCIKNTAILAENLLAKAFIRYIEKNHVPPKDYVPKPETTTEEVMGELVKSLKQQEQDTQNENT